MAKKPIVHIHNGLSRRMLMCHADKEASVPPHEDVDRKKQNVLFSFKISHWNQFCCRSASQAVDLTYQI